MSRGLASAAAYAEALIAAARVSARASALPAPVSAAGVLLFVLCCLPASPFKPAWGRDDVVRVQRIIDVREASRTPEPASQRTVRPPR